ncbi:MAG TPA: 2-C-methyl-D-erythritol 4-phosphate cytidylyltransferase, partial [Gemmatimonadales bacterium]
VPLLLRALDPFLTHPEVAMVVAVVPPEEAERPPDWLAEIAGVRLRVVSGGGERYESVRAGLAVLSSACEIVLVHDGARPFPSHDVIEQVVAVARSGRAAIAALPLGDTLKEAERTDDGVVVRRTIPRDELWRAQTPQGFPRALIERAYLENADLVSTDDAQLVERLGVPVVLVPDLSSNLKVTTPEDLQIAEALLVSARQPVRSPATP